MQCLHLLYCLCFCKIKIYMSGEHSFPMHDYTMHRRGANICTLTRSSCIHVWSLHFRVDRQNPNPSIVRLNSFYLLSQTGGVLHWHVAFHPLHYRVYPVLDKHGWQRIKVGRRVIQMLFPMIQMANNDMQSACLIFDNAFYMYRTRLFIFRT